MPRGIGEVNRDATSYFGVASPISSARTDMAGDGDALRARFSAGSRIATAAAVAQYVIDVSSVTQRPFRTTDNADSETPLWSSGPNATL